ncbi:MAG: hypothetical protein GY798_25875 [Hyphomicrobiales bacterium]|nr:hypothetical protein [Hyphomicrobiales bacterium]
MLGLVVWSAMAIIFYAGALSFAPALVAIVLAEAFGWRSVFYWLAVGGGIGLAGRLYTAPAAALPDNGEHIALHLGAGFVGGLVYWLIAGRLAGISGSTRQPAPPDPSADATETLGTSGSRTRQS